MCALATARRFARASQGRCAHAARRRESRHAAWRCKPRVGTADCIAGRCKGCIRAAERRFCNRFQQRAVWTTQWCCTRARGGRGLRDAEMHRLTNRDCGLSERRTQMCGVKLPCVRLHPSEAKLRRVPKEAYLKPHPRNTPLVTAARTERFAAQPQRTHATRVTPSDRGYIIRREPRGCCPGHTVLRTRRGCRAQRTKKRPLRTPPPPR